MDSLDSAQLDYLSAPAREALKLDFAGAYTKLTTHGDGNAGAYALLHPLAPETVLSKKPLDRNPAAAVLSGLWLWHDWLDESHTLSQDIHTPTGSYWHAIMHRREGDFSNAKYWHAKFRNHPVYSTLAQNADAILNPHPADKSLLKLTINGWNPDAFVDLVEAANDNPSHPHRDICVSLQQLEWRLLFDHCVRAAV